MLIPDFLALEGIELVDDNNEIICTLRELVPNEKTKAEKHKYLMKNLVLTDGNYNMENFEDDNSEF